MLELGATSEERPLPTASRRTSWLAERCEWLALLIAVLTVCGLPWLLGGVVPLARLVLLTGTLSAAGLCLLSVLLNARRRFAVPVPAVLATGLAAQGVLQLLPVYAPPVSQMQHAVYPELRWAALSLHPPAAAHTESTGVNSADTATANTAARAAADTAAVAMPVGPRTVSPSDTRLAVGQWLSLALLTIVGFQTVSSRSRLTMALSLLVLNGVVLSLVSLLQLFGDGQMLVGSQWILFDSKPFGPFTNANNAAGWLCTHLAAAVALMVLVWGKTPDTGLSRPFEDPSLRDQLWNLMYFVQQRIAHLNNRQILVIAAVLVVLAGVSASLSRAGIMAAVLSLVVASVCRLQWKQALLMLVPLLLITAATALFLILLDMDTLIFAELRTLKDPVSETTGRLLHWTDVLHSVMDFPVLGTGMNAYRYATLPYVAHSFEKWFYHADNQFVEVVVENGLPGLLLVAGIGGLLLIAGLRLNAAALRHRKSGSTVLLSLGLVAIIMVSAQVISAFFDYGIGLPAASAAIMLLCGVVLSPFAPDSELAGAAGGGGGGTGGHRLRLRSGVWKLPRALYAGLLLMLMSAAGGLVADAWHAQGVYRQVVAVDRLLKKPVSRAELAQLPAVQQDLANALSHRPDDINGWTSFARLQEARFRLALIGRLGRRALLSDDQFLRLWELLTPPGASDRLLALRQIPDQVEYADLKRVIQETQAEHDWTAAAENVLAQVPLVPGLALDLLAQQSLVRPQQLQLSLVSRVMFNEPAHARRLFQAGYLCLRCGYEAEATAAWQASVAASESFRNAVLMESAGHWDPPTAVRMFGPAHYGETVQAAAALPDVPVRPLLWHLADEQWRFIQEAPSAKQAFRRAQHLQSVEGDEAAIQWLEQRLAETPEDLDLAVLSATLLEKVGRKREAISEWSRIQYFHPDHVAAAKAIERLIDEL